MATPDHGKILLEPAANASALAPDAKGSSAPPLLSIEGLHVQYRSRHASVTAVQDVSLDVHAGESLGLIGESGCGKSTVALSILRLLPPHGRITKGRLIFKGENILRRSHAELRSLRGNRIAMVFQEPMVSLNPVFTIRDQVEEALHIHMPKLDRTEIRARVEGTLRMTGITDTDRVLSSYPHELSGGLRQRAMIAMSLICMPDVLIADEPTTAIDVTVQAQIIRLLNTLRTVTNMALLMISHDPGLIAATCDRVAVMYAGRIIETGSVHHIFHTARHPYTHHLLSSIPSRTRPKHALPVIPGHVSHADSRTKGCPFAPRCPRVLDRCHHEMPPATASSPTHLFHCWSPIADIPRPE